MSAGRRCDQQSLRLFHAERPAVRLCGFGGSREGYGYEAARSTAPTCAVPRSYRRRRQARARGPRTQLVVASTLRLAGHGEHDDASYVTDEIRRQPFAQDSLQRTEQLILEQELLDRESLQQMRAELAAEVDEAVATAQQEDAPVGSEEDWCAVATRSLVDQPALA